jgi:hypothetical protein
MGETIFPMGETIGIGYLVFSYVLGVILIRKIGITPDPNKDDGLYPYECFFTDIIWLISPLTVPIFFVIWSLILIGMVIGGKRTLQK